MGNLFARISKTRRRLKNLTNVFDGREPRVLLLGIDGAGKTTLLYKAKLDNAIFANIPPRGINIELMTPRRGARIQVFDMPGSKLTRYLWQDWYRSTEAIVYVVDCSDRVRIDEAKFELHELLQSRDLRRVPLVVVANKEDIDGAMCADVISAELDLTSIKDRDWSIHTTCAHKGTGISRVFQDVVDKIKAFRHYKSALTTNNNTTNKVSNKIANKSKDQKSDLQLSSIEVVDKNDYSEVPSLFDSINKQTIIKDEIFENGNRSGGSDSNPPEYDRSSAGNGSGGSDSNPPEYDRPEKVNQEDANSDTNQKEISNCSDSSDFRTALENVTDIDNVINEYDTDKTDDNVKVTDLDADSNDASSATVSFGEEYAKYDHNNVYEFEANIPIAVV